MLTLDRLKELFTYDPNTGCFIHLTANKARGSCARLKGDIAGYLDTASGYWRLTIDRKQYQAHVIAYFYMTGVMPNYVLGEEINHKDRIKSNNKWDNLRLADKYKNRQNIPAYSNNKSGYKGVSQIQSGRWIAQIKFNKQYKKFGPFDTPKEASEAYKKAKAELHTFQPEIK